MTERRQAPRYRFGVFEADTATGELRRQGMRVKLNTQPFQVLCMLLERPGELLTREEISHELWPDGTFVDFDHGVNSAVNRVREALGDTAGSPRFIETLARRGYRFVAPVERIVAGENSTLPAANSGVHISQEASVAPADPATRLRNRILASPQELPKVAYPVVQTLFSCFSSCTLASTWERWPILRRSRIFLAAAKGDRHPQRPDHDGRNLIPVRAFVLARYSCARPRSSRNSSGSGRFCYRRCALVALAVSAAAPHQLRAGSCLHRASRLLALRAALNRAHGRRP